MSLLMVSLSLLLNSRAFIRDMINPFSEAKFANSWKYDIAGLMYNALLMFMLRYLRTSMFTNLDKRRRVDPCYTRLTNDRDRRTLRLLRSPGDTLRWSLRVKHHRFREALGLEEAVADELRRGEVMLLICRIGYVGEPFGDETRERVDPPPT